MAFTPLPWPHSSDYGTRTQTSGIVIHHSAVNSTWPAIDRYHKSLGWGGIGYNVGIAVDGSVTVFGLISDWRAHTYGYNSTMVGVCFMAVDEPSPVQISVGWEVVQWLRGMYGQVPLYRHSALVATACPGNWNITTLEESMPHGPVSIPSELWTLVQKPKFVDHLDQEWGVANELVEMANSLRAIQHGGHAEKADQLAARLYERIVAIKVLFGL